MQNRRSFLTVSAAIIGLSGCTSDGESSDGESNNEQEQPPGTNWYDSNTGIGVLNGVEAEVDSIGSMYIRGVAENFSDNDYEYVQLSWDIYDDADRKIADGLANTSGLNTGQQWRFEALAASAEDASSYALAEVDAY